MTNQQHSLLIPGLLLSAGIAMAGFFISQTIYNARVAINTAEAKGLAERRTKADRANWKILFTVSGDKREDLPELYKKAEQQQKIIVDLLIEGGFSEKEIRPGVIDYQSQQFRDDKQKLVDEIHSLVGDISVETDKVERVGVVRSKVNRLIAQGIAIENRPPAYRFTKLNAIKPEMLREATKNARLAANEFASNAGVKVGGIRSARQGSFYVIDAGEEYGDTAKLEKDVRVVTTITFYLTD
ncbi:Protein of unknown function DUF541 [hydrothermal vent metagenome]|uniref:Periplasmic protein n=1 Tax=hydrothermal vent metagenome TaxID=652676 RepID=A0A3B0X7E5_9ZZZZ